MQNIYGPMILRLAQGEWFTGRVTACFLFNNSYTRSGSLKEKLRKKFVELCNEDTPMIRRACASRLGNFSTQIEKNYVIQDLLPVFRQLS